MKLQINNETDGRIILNGYILDKGDSIMLEEEVILPKNAITGEPDYAELNKLVEKNIVSLGDKKAKPEPKVEVEAKPEPVVEVEAKPEPEVEAKPKKKKSKSKSKK